MNILEAVESRRSIRAFESKPVDSSLLKKILEQSLRSPSGGNLQPWNFVVITGDVLNALTTRMKTRLMEGPEEPEYDIYPKGLVEPYHSRRFGVGEALYVSVNIPREDKMARLQQLAENFQFFNAPVGLFLHTPKFMGPPQWADMGMWLQTLMLLLRGEGLDSCAQEAWSTYPQTVREFVPIPSGDILFCGMAIGYRDNNAPINNFEVDRAPLDEVGKFIGI